MFEKAKKLEDQNEDLEHQIDIVLKAKNNLEKYLKDEKVTNEKLKAQLAVAES